MSQDGHSPRLLDSIPAMVAYVDRSGVYRHVNPAFRARYARGGRDLVGQTFEELSGELYSFLRPYVDGALAGEVQEFEVLGNAEATRGRWLRTTFVPDPGEDARVAGFYAIVQDIHDGKSVKLEHDRLLFACDQGMEGFALHDAQGRFTYVNPAMASMYGYTTDELFGRSWKTLYGEEEVRRIEEECLPRLTERGQWHGELVGRRRSGESIDVEISLNLLTDEHGAPDGLACNSRDITERKQAEESLRQLQRMDALGQLTGGLAHDFNNLLSIILGNLVFVQKALPQGTEEYAMLDEAKKAAESSAELTKRLLAFAREHALELVLVNVCELVDEMESVLARSLGEEIDLRIEHTSPVARCKTDKPQLHNAILNLMLNARDAMALRDPATRANSVTIRTGVTPGSGGGPDQVFLAVADTGVGMPREVRERMFDPFFSTKDSGRGTGLGLSIIHGFVTQSGGHLEVESEIGQGTCVTLFLPATAEDDLDAATKDTACPTGHGERVLVVEDTEEVLKVVSHMLRSLGYEVIAATDATTAMEQARRGERLDAVVSDIRLPGGVRGDDLAVELEALHPGLGKVFMSGYVGERAAPAGIRLLTKPFPIEDMAQALHAVL